MYRRELATLLGRMLRFDRLVIGAERDGVESTGSVRGATSLAGRTREPLVADEPRGTAPRITFRWRSLLGSHWLQIVSEQGVSPEELALWTELMPTIKLAEAHWLAIEGVRGAPSRSIASVPTGQKPALDAGDESLAPSRPFINAVRDALRHLHELSRLATSPLLDLEVVTTRTSAHPVAQSRVRALQQVLSDLVEELSHHASTEFWHRALHHTYLVPSDTQLRAAELSRTSYGSYRRFVARGVSEVAMRLWLLERTQRKPAAP